MLIGIAPNAWLSWNLDDVSAGNAASARNRAKIIAEAADPPWSKGVCPMRWVNADWGTRVRYNPATSRFWSDTREVVASLKIADQASRDWASNLVWSNLYLISPAGGGNPTGRLKSIQEKGNLCHEILRETVEHWAPRRILFITGHWAMPLVHWLPSVSEIPHLDPKMILFTGRYSEGTCNADVVVAVRPERRWKRDDFVKAVVGAFDNLKNQSP